MHVNMIWDLELLELILVVPVFLFDRPCSTNNLIRVLRCDGIKTCQAEHDPVCYLYQNLSDILIAGNILLTQILYIKSIFCIVLYLESKQKTHGLSTEQLMTVFTDFIKGNSKLTSKSL